MSPCKPPFLMVEEKSALLVANKLTPSIAISIIFGPLPLSLNLQSILKGGAVACSMWDNTIVSFSSLFITLSTTNN